MSEATHYGLQRVVASQAKETITEQGKLFLPDAIETLERALAELRALNPAEVKSLHLEWSYTAEPFNDTGWTITIERSVWQAQPIVGPAV